MKTDSPIVEEVRTRRRELSKLFGDDLGSYVRQLRKVEDSHRQRVVHQITVVPDRSIEPLEK